MAEDDQAAEIHRLKREFTRVTEERDKLKLQTHQQSLKFFYNLIRMFTNSWGSC